MTGGVECARTTETLVEAARKMRDLDVGALPICGEDDRLAGMLTDRDIVLRCVADGANPSTVRVADYAGDETVTIGADDSVEEALRTMTDHGVRRLPVIDGHDLVGVVSQADVARHLPDGQVARLVEAISAAPANN
ncbi:CBS domain-containing protein [Nocardioides sp. MAHUQ-72]|uniref:CBS domain-containing protein n=1 Tax=unclassified Nocardioides TaxID=2615069 RepID=UPI00361EAB87